MFEPSGRFGGSRLVLDSFAGTTKRGGTVTGRGVFDLGAASGFGDGHRAPGQGGATDRPRRHQGAGDRPDHASARTASGGIISGKVDLVSGSFRLGSATAAAQVPRLDVREINRPADERPAPRRLAPWRLDLDGRGATTG